MQSAPSAADAAKAALKAEADISAAEEAAEEVRFASNSGLTDHGSTVF
jgi:hypothetical protein